MSSLQNQDKLPAGWERKTQQCWFFCALLTPEEKHRHKRDRSKPGKWLGVIPLTKKQTLFKFHQFVFWVFLGGECIVRRNFITGIDLCTDTELFYHQREAPSCYPFQEHPTPIITPGKSWCVRHHYKAVIWRKLYKWNHIACNLWDWLCWLSKAL